MTAYLITFKPYTENPERGWPEEKLAALARQVQRYGAAREPWRFNRKKDVKVGERVATNPNCRACCAMSATLKRDSGKPRVAGSSHASALIFGSVLDATKGHYSAQINSMPMWHYPRLSAAKLQLISLSRTALT